ncbi:MAG TPA: exonuclease domain-containing protein [Steroidobacteraceae bacterium]|nr:exonuclease domain-containing protein [Steroidobacteraceae bacterium]
MAAAEIEGLPPPPATEDAALPRDLVFVDLETTGGNAAHDRITEVGLVRVQDGELVEEWSSLVNPECPISPYIEAFTGISDAMVAGAPRFAEIAELVRQKLQGAMFVAHNARFDYSFLRSEFRKADMNFSATVLCTVKLSRRLFPEFVRHNLDAVMERNGLTCSARHRALGDARVLHDFWCKLRREVMEPRLAAAVRSAVGARKLPPNLPPDLADELPEGPGVYRFFGADGELLYVGRCSSLRTRVLEQLADAQPESRQQKLAYQVRRVDWVQTAGELGAMLLEAQWIKTLKPAYNRRVKEKAGTFTLRPAGGRIETVPIDAVAIEDLTQCFGVFHSAQDARKALLDIAHARQLCSKVLGLEQSEGSCLAFQVGKCRGACIGKEPLLLHNTRLQLALSSLKLKAWPFPGRIALRERGAGSDGWGATPGTDLHVVDHWTYLGTARSDEELAVLGARRECAGFDVDVYRILVRYFSKRAKLDWHELAPQDDRNLSR